MVYLDRMKRFLLGSSPLVAKFPPGPTPAVAAELKRAKVGATDGAAPQDQEGPGKAPGDRENEVRQGLARVFALLFVL